MLYYILDDDTQTGFLAVSSWHDVDADIFSKILNDLGNNVWVVDTEQLSMDDLNRIRNAKLGKEIYEAVSQLGKQYIKSDSGEAEEGDSGLSEADSIPEEKDEEILL